MKSHNEYIAYIKDTYSKINKRKITDAFLYSLSTNNTVYRGFLACYAIARVLPLHDINPIVYQSGHVGCKYCGFSETLDIDTIHLEEELKNWGGVRFQDIFTIGYYLGKIIDMEVPDPTKKDFDIFNNLIDCILQIERNAKARDLEKIMSKVLKSNKGQREMILNQLGIIGLLQTKEHKGYFDTFDINRELPNLSKIDWLVPIAWWRGIDGIDWKVYNYYFSDYQDLKR
jgi:hypothetical protein